MDNSTIKIVLVSSLIVLGGGVAMAKGPGGSSMTFEEIDVDGSGEITTEDFAAMRDARFAELDANSDGSISLEEFTASQMARSEERATRMFERLDADGDGALGRDVLESQRRGNGGERMISRFDEDGSGGLSAEEFEEARAKMGERRKGERGDRDKRRN